MKLFFKYGWMIPAVFCAVIGFMGYSNNMNAGLGWACCVILGLADMIREAT